jgi:UDP-N-acetylmuramoylalanine--D-glutamate ligase
LKKKTADNKTVTQRSRATGRAPAVFDTVIVGLGTTGLASARWLAARGERIAVTDSRRHPPQLEALRASQPEVPLSLGGFDAELLRKAARILLSPGVSLREPAIQQAIAAGIPVIGDVELFCRAACAPAVAITGSNGKSTVTSLLGAMMQAAGRRAGVGANLGTPALDLITDPEPDFYILELSSFQLETVTSLNAAAAAVLNVTPDHLDRHADIAEYAALKARVYAGDGVMVINLDDPLVAAMRQPQRKVLTFTLGAPQADGFGVRDVAGEVWLVRGAEPLLRGADLRIRGQHNIANALAALALGAAIGLPLPAMRAALANFPGLPHRCQFVARVRGVDWYDDSKGTNVGACCAAIRGLAGANDVVLIAGGDGKGQEFADLARAARGRLRAAVLIGRDAPRIEAVLQGVVPVARAEDMRAAVLAAAGLACAGDKVLLSPACASFDMFRDYRDRGEQFAAAVRELGA